METREISSQDKNGFRCPQKPDHPSHRNLQGLEPMKNNRNDFFRNNTVFIYLALVIVVILSIPLVAILFSREVDWSVMDFVTIGGLLIGMGLIFILAARKSSNLWYRLAAATALGTAFLLVWANLAVGLIGDGLNMANLMYFVIPILCLIGALMVRMQPVGMAAVLFATALVQVLVTVIGLVFVKGQLIPAESTRSTLVEIGANIFFTALWIVSGWLFLQAAPPKPEPAL
jgi:hypothetical protein